MRGQWNMDPEELKNWVLVFDEHILPTAISNGEVDLTDMNLNPENVKDILIALGFNAGDYDMNGWEADRWQYFSHPDKDNLRFTVFSCGMTFELKLTCDEKE